MVEAYENDSEEEPDIREEKYRTITSLPGVSVISGQKNKAILLKRAAYSDTWEYIPFNIKIPGIVDALVKEFMRIDSDIKNIYDVWDKYKDLPQMADASYVFTKVKGIYGTAVGKNKL